jgi:carboxyl-terminal processing protease
MASWFLPAGKVIVSEDFGKNGPKVSYKSRGYNAFGKNLKFAILVNGGSASASEILAGALKEHGIAKLVGTTTFGKGSVQELVDITPETSLKVTIARWLTPNGNSISEKGIKPDLEVKLTAEDLAKGRDLQMDAASKLLLNQK